MKLTLCTENTSRERSRMIIKMNKGLHYLLSAFILLSLISCAIMKSPDQADSLTSGISKDTAESVDEYVLQIGDVIDIKFYYDPKLNETVIIRPDGKISLQLIGELAGAGLTPSGLNKIINDKYTKFLRNPEVVVILKEYGGQRVYVGGEVLTPGVIPLKGSTTALQAIFNVGGFKETARLGSVIIISKGLKDVPEVRKIDLDVVVSGKAPEKDILLKPYDIVYVPKTFIAKANKFVEQYIKNLIPGNLSGGFSYAIIKGSQVVP